MAIELSKKICLLGDFSVGKSSLVRRFVENRFDEQYLSTIGVRVSRKIITLPHNTTMKLLIWDTAGSEPFTTIIRSYYQGSAGALLVCDLTRSETVATLMQYAHEFRQVNPGTPLVLIANKVDLAGQRVITDELLVETSTALAAPWLLSSAKTGEGVEHAFQLLAEIIYKERKPAV